MNLPPASPPDDRRNRPVRRSAALWLAALLVAGSTAAVQQVRERTPRPFLHVQHDALECTECHSTREAHGRLMVTSPADCQRCHHTPRFAEPCARCHAPATPGTPPIPIAQTLRTGGGATALRMLPFSHGQHTELVCSDCHEARAPFAATVATCTDCHDRHHTPVNDCMACHTPPREDVHARAAHLTCTGAGCHDAGRAWPDPPRTRNTCLSCHQDLADHLPDQECIDCHVLPRRSGAGHP